jgi:hypothetical protein
MSDTAVVPVRTFVRGKLKKNTATLTPDDLFDKIINLRFWTRDNMPYMTIRSDYEVVYDRKPPHHAHFIPIKQKPHIKVSYHQVSSTTAIQMEIEVSTIYFSDKNLHDGVEQEVVGTDGGAVTQVDSARGNPIQWIEVQMGYRSQFPDWTKEPRATGTGYFDRFFDMDNNAASLDQNIFEGKVLMARVLECHATSYPPDQMYVFNCVVATIDRGLRWNHKESIFLTTFKLIEAPPITDPDTGAVRDRTQIERLLYHLITRRFCKTYIRARIIPPDVEKNVPERLSIFAYNDWIALSKQEKIKELDNGWTDVQLGKDGLMPIADAEVFGVPCYVTRGLRAVSTNTLVSYALRRNAALKPDEASPPITLESTVQAQVLAIQKAYPGIRWYQLTNGGYFFYYEKETVDAVYGDDARKRTALQDIVTLPAIYDISLDGLRTIRCPFIGFINPLTMLQWNSRYTLNTLVGYFYRPKPGKNYYLALLIKVVFDTDGDNNVMEIKVSDIPANIAEARAAGGSGSSADNNGGNGGKTYAAIKRPVICHKKPAPTESCSVIIERYLRPSARANLAAWGGEMPSVERMANDFKSWNPRYFEPAEIWRRNLGAESKT